MLLHGQAGDWRTDTHTHAGNDNTRRPKLASGKNPAYLTLKHKLWIWCMLWVFGQNWTCYKDHMIPPPPDSKDPRINTFLSDQYQSKSLLSGPIHCVQGLCTLFMLPPIASFMGPTWGPSGADRTQVGPVNLAIWDVVLVYGLYWLFYPYSSRSFHCQWASPGVGVTKAPFVNFSVSKIFDLAEVPVRLFVSYSYLTGVTPAKLRQHLSNMNMIFNR